MFERIALIDEQDNLFFERGLPNGQETL